MTKIREIIKQQETTALSLRQTAKATGISRPVISVTKQRFKDSGLTLEQVKAMSDSALRDALSENKPQSLSKSEQLKKEFPYVLRELNKTGINLRLLWEEYREKDPYGLGYTQYCYHFRHWKDESKLSMHIDHKAGERMFIDYTGKRMELTCLLTGDKTPVEIYIAILPASQYTYAEASLNQRKESFMRSTERAIWYFGGTPSVLVPENLKSAVLKADFYEPTLNPLFADFAEHYRSVVIPARSKKPKDKAYC